MSQYKDKLEDLATQLKSLSEYQQANAYFMSCTEKVFIEKWNYLAKKGYLQTFKEYMESRYQGNCYYYSTYALMGLRSTDSVVRGKINVDENGISPDASTYKHGWVEFEYLGKKWVYDCLIDSIIERDLYYEHKLPIITYKATLEDVISEYTKVENCQKIIGTEYLIKSFALVYNTFNPDNTHLASAMSNARITLDEDKKLVKKFIACSHDYC